MDTRGRVMSLSEKLSFLEDEIQILQRYCVDKGYSPLEIEEKAQPLLKLCCNGKKSRHIRTGIITLVIGLVIYGLCWVTPLYRLMTYMGRTTSLKVLPLYDWTHFYSDECLVYNPYFTPAQLTLDDCVMCEHLVDVEMVSNVSSIIMAENYIKRDIPVIVTDAIQDWHAFTEFDIDYIHEIYSDALREPVPCMFSSNVRVKYGNVKGLLDKAVRGQISHWFAHWENCERDAGRYLRYFYTRPYFMPAMVEMSDINWLFVSSNFASKYYKPVDVDLPLIWYAQLKGEAELKLLPRNPCNSTCQALHTTIHAGELILLTDFMWSLLYKPLASHQTVALAGGGIFD